MFYSTLYCFLVAGFFVSNPSKTRNPKIIPLFKQYLKGLGFGIIFAEFQLKTNIIGILEVE